MGKEIKVQSIGSLLEETVEEITIKASGIDVPKSGILSTGLLNLDEVLHGSCPAAELHARGGVAARHAADALGIRVLEIADEDMTLAYAVARREGDENPAVAAYVDIVRRLAKG